MCSVQKLELHLNDDIRVMVFARVVIAGTLMAMARVILPAFALALETAVVMDYCLHYHSTLLKKLKGGKNEEWKQNKIKICSEIMFVYNLKASIV